MLNVVSRERVLGVAAQHALAAVDGGQVVDGQRWVGVQGVGALADVLGALLGARGAGDGDGGAVHVVLLCSGQLGGPGPGVGVGAGGNVGGDLDVVCARTGAVLGGATALDGQDDGPPCACAGLHVCA